jgi:hypothetical protein
VTEHRDSVPSPDRSPLSQRSFWGVRPFLQVKGLFITSPVPSSLWSASTLALAFESCGPGTFADRRLDKKRRIPLKNVLRARVSSLRLLCLFIVLLLAFSGYGRYQSQIEVSYTSCPGAPALLEFLPLMSLRWPRFLPRQLRLPGSLLCLPAAAGFTWQFRFAPDLRATIKCRPRSLPVSPRRRRA